MTEIWKAVVGFEGLYEVSNLGRIKSLPRTKRGRQCFWMTKEKIMKPSLGRDYYNFSAISSEGKKIQLTVHRCVALAFHPAIPGKDQVNHIDGIKTNNHSNNLEWVSNKENSLHAKRMGLLNPSIGEANPGSKLTEDQVRDIRSRYEKGVRGPNNGVALAAEYGVSNVTIHYIVHRDKWLHI